MMIQCLNIFTICCNIHCIVTIDASGGSDIHGYELAADYCIATSSGGSDIHITANKGIVSHASGGSDVHYKGNASVTSIRSGGSSVKKVSE
jgi:hypothetical protein